MHNGSHFSLQKHSSKISFYKKSKEFCGTDCKNKDMEDSFIAHTSCMSMYNVEIFFFETSERLSDSSLFAQGSVFTPQGTARQMELSFCR